MYFFCFLRFPLSTKCHLRCKNKTKTSQIWSPPHNQNRERVGENLSENLLADLRREVVGQVHPQTLQWVQANFQKGDVWTCLNLLLGRVKKNVFFLGDLSQICLPTHPPQGFCEIWEYERWNSGQKGRFSGWFGGFSGVWTLFGNQLPHPPTFVRNLPRKKVFFGRLSLIEKSNLLKDILKIPRNVILSTRSLRACWASNSS